jgi:hypothetical protein
VICDGADAGDEAGDGGDNAGDASDEAGDDDEAGDALYVLGVPIWS